MIPVPFSIYYKKTHPIQGKACVVEDNTGGDFETKVPRELWKFLYKSMLGAAFIILFYTLTLSLLWWVYYNVEQHGLIQSAIAAAIFAAVWSAMSYTRTCIKCAAIIVQRESLKATRGYEGANVGQAHGAKDHDVVTGDSAVLHKS
ncbi:MAG: hypothetical protein AAB727_01990 [Patescibacteria group bacterium]